MGKDSKNTEDSNNPINKFGLVEKHRSVLSVTGKYTFLKEHHIHVIINILHRLGY